MEYKVVYHPLIFKTPGGTSRGILTQKDSWWLFTQEAGQFRGVSEVSFLRGLSIESYEDIDKALSSGASDSNISSVKMGLEILKRSLAHEDPFHVFDSSFYSGTPIPINGLIWMGDKSFMFNQIKAKIKAGFTCIKLKIGAIDFEEELALLAYIRQQFTPEEITLRVDANGAFAANSALEKLKRLSDYQLHSIEQPIAAGRWQEMAQLCDATPLPIALDEELIPIRYTSDKVALLDTIKPQYIILKPALIGGFAHADEWVKLAQESNIGWWATSALEGNIGLNAIAQWVAQYKVTTPQGLGTGQLFTNNIPSPLSVDNGLLHYSAAKSWDIDFVQSS